MIALTLVGFFSSGANTLVLVALFQKGWMLHPAKCVTWDLNKVGETDALLDSPDKMRSRTVNGIGDNILEGKRITFLDPLKHFDGKLGHVRCLLRHFEPIHAFASST
jgi:hypothetical protein